MAAGALGAAALLGSRSPHIPGFYPTCPSLLLTGFYCPGCGSLRAIHDLWHGDVGGAWDMNPALVLALPYLAGVWAAWLVRVTTGRPRRYVAPAALINLVLGVVLAFWVLRNVPALHPYLAP